MSRLFIGIQDEDTFEGYTDNTGLNGLNKGLIWAGGWVDIDLYAGMTALDSFETYPDDEDINDLNDGTGFAGAWVDPGLTISS